MGSIVKELQQDWLNPQVKTSHLLRKALFVAKKLEAKDFEAWCSKELQGYDAGSVPPDYRMVTGEFVAWNPYMGWVPVYCKDAKTAQVMSKRGCGQSIPELESLADRSKESDAFHISLPKAVEIDVLRSIDPLTRPRLHVSHSALIKIINSVRTILFNWAVQLEKDGILGESLSFTEQEKTSAAAIPQTINNFHGPVGVSQIQQHSNNSSQVMIANLDLEKVQQFVAAVRGSMDQLNLSKDDSEELNAELQTIDSQVNSPRPKTTIIAESLQSIRRIFENVTGGLGLQLLKNYLGW